MTEDVGNDNVGVCVDGYKGHERMNEKNRQKHVV